VSTWLHYLVTSPKTPRKGIDTRLKCHPYIAIRITPANKPSVQCIPYKAIINYYKSNAKERFSSLYDDIFYSGVAGRETRNALGYINTSTVWNRITRKNIGTYRYGLSRIEPEPSLIQCTGSEEEVRKFGLLDSFPPFNRRESKYIYIYMYP
jgi:hypothetical protein